MAVADIPGRIFLDTCVVNFILDFGEQIHDGVAVPPQVDERDALDIEAFYNLFLVGQRAMWQLAISPHTYFEIARTREDSRRSGLDRWFQELWQYWQSIVDASDDLPTFIEAEDHRVRTLSSGYLDTLPDVGDRVLLCDAIVYRCELFCTRDWSTIIRHRSELKGLPIEIVTPSEWWARIRLHAAL
jgi:hypothetical protein